MARQLSAVPDVAPPDSDYPAGRIQNDNPPTTDGTPVIEELYGDIIQFFHKLMRLAGLSYNDVAENETAGFQFIEAMATYIRTLQATTTTKGTSELATSAETEAGSDTQRTVTPNGFLTAFRNKLKLHLGTSTLDITAAGTYQLTNSHTMVNVDVNITYSDVIIRMPNAGNDNKGKQIKISLNAVYLGDGGGLKVYNASTGTTELYSLFEIYEDYIDFLIFKSDGTTWELMVEMSESIRLGTTVYKGIVQLALSVDSQAGTSTSKAVTPSSQASRDGGLRTKVIEIGDWNMLITPNLPVAHGLTYANIIECHVLIRNDGDTIRTKLDLNVGGVTYGFYSFGTSNIDLSRASGFYDNTNYDSTSYNRGWIIIRYLQ